MRSTIVEPISMVRQIVPMQCSLPVRIGRGGLRWSPKGKSPGGDTGQPIGQGADTSEHVYQRTPNLRADKDGGAGACPQRQTEFHQRDRAILPRSEAMAVYRRSLALAAIHAALPQGKIRGLLGSSTGRVRGGKSSKTSGFLRQLPHF